MCFEQINDDQEIKKSPCSATFQDGRQLNRIVATKAALFCFVPQMSFVSDFYGMNFAFVLQTETEGIFKKVARATLELPYCLYDALIN